jgi:hypothetical protein
MKHLKIAGLCLVSMLMMGMALAGNASAAPLLWLLCLKEGTSGSTPTKYTTNQCTTAGANNVGEWQSSGLPSGGKDTVRLLGFSLELKDTGIGTTVICPDAGISTGYIESGKLVTTVAESKTPEGEGCKLEGTFLTCKAGKLEELKGIHLPWTSELFETAGKNLSNIVGTGGHPGWSIKCGGATDTCEEGTEKTEFTEDLNGVTKGVLLVLAIFQHKVKANCSVGGALKGEVKGLIAILLNNGNGLSITQL